MPQEFLEAQNIWCLRAQQESFAEEIASCLLPLNPFVDKENLLRVGGRLQHSILDPDQKHPIILPAKARVANLIIEEAHSRMLHSGTQLTLAYLRRKYWIIQGRNAVKTVIKKCLRCKRFQASQVYGESPSAASNSFSAFLP